VQLLWNESSDKWTFTNDGSTYYDLPTSVVASFNGLTGAVQGVSSASAGTGISVSAATGAVTITNTGVQSFNGNTGAVTGASLGANTFTGTQTLTAGLTTSYLYASTGSTFASTLQVSGGATFSGRVDVGGNFKVLGDSQLGDASTDTLTVYAGTTFQNRTDFAGSNNFANGLSASGILTTTSNIKFNGTTEKSIYTSQAPLTIAGYTSGPSIGNENSIVFGVQTDSSLTLNSTTGTIVFSTTTAGENPSVAKISLVTDDADIYGGQSVTIGPSTYLTGTRTLTVPDDSGTIALTKNVISSFNGRTGSVQGVSAAVAGTGISVSGATGSVTITNIGVQSFNGLTGAVGGVTTSVANTFTALQTFNSGITASGITTSSLYVSGGVVSTQGFTFGSGTTFMQWVPNTSANNGGLWLRDGNFQVGGSQIGAGYGSFYYVPNSERFYVFGYSDINNSYDYQAGRPSLRLNVGPNQTAPILAAYGQTASGTILAATYRTTNRVAGIDNKGAFFTTVGISAAGGITFNSTAQFTAGLSASAVYASTGSTFVNNVSFNSTTSHTGLATFSGGVSGAGGITLSGTIAFNGQTFTNVVHSVNGNTGALGYISQVCGVTTGTPTYTYPDGVTTYNAGKQHFYFPTYMVSSDSSGFTVRANRLYFSLFNVEKATTINTIRVVANNTGTTGNCYLAVYSADANTGLPKTKLWESSSLTVGSGYAKTQSTSINYTVPAGNFYIAATFSSTPTMYGWARAYMNYIWGAPDTTSGYRNYYPVADTNGFTLPSSVVATSGVTFAFVDYIAVNYHGVRIEYAI
jgi:hypothetical protein